MDRFHLMSVFIAVAEAESFAGGARKLNMSPPAVTRAVAALEERLGVKLLSRTTRFVRTTDAGARYLENAKRIMLEADEADDAAAGVDAEPRGHLAITAPMLFGRMFVTPFIVDYLKRYPDMSISALFLDRVVNLLEEGVDIGVRIGPLPDSSMHALKVGEVRRVVCASPAYLKKNGTPQTPGDLVNHTIIAASNVTSSVEWRFGQAKKSSSIKVAPRLFVTSNDAAIVAALQNFGITRLLSYQVAPHLNEKKLKAVLTEFEQEPLPIHILYREGRHAAAKVRTFVDFLASALRADPALR